MSQELDKAVGFEYEPQPVGWNQRDLLLYVVGIGAQQDELPLAYELHPDWTPFPTYPLVLPFRGDSPTVVNYAEAASGTGKRAPGLPKINPLAVVHGEQFIKILRPLPKEAKSSDGWKLIKKLGGVHDKGRGHFITNERGHRDGQGNEYCEMISNSFCFGKYNLGGFSKSVSPKLSVQTKSSPPKRAPDFTVTDQTTKEQALVYRLSGDYNPLHIDPAIGKKLGFGGIILHGLASYGNAARAVVKTAAGGDGTRLKEMGGRFTSPVLPGQTLVTQIWTEPATDGSGDIQVDFVQTVKETGKDSVKGCALIAKNSAKGKGKL